MEEDAVVPRTTCTPYVETTHGDVPLAAGVSFVTLSSEVILARRPVFLAGWTSTSSFHPWPWKCISPLISPRRRTSVSGSFYAFAFTSAAACTFATAVFTAALLRTLQFWRVASGIRATIAIRANAFLQPVAA